MNYFEVGNYQRKQQPKTDLTTFFVHMVLVISLVLYFNGVSLLIVIPYIFFTMLAVAYFVILYRGIKAQEQNSPYVPYFKRINSVVYLRIFFYITISVVLYVSGHTIISIIWMVPLFIILLFKF